MGRGVRFVLALMVAMLYRHPSPPVKTSRPTDARQPVLRPWTDPTRSPQTPTQVTQALPVRTPRAMIRASLEKNEPPPRLARTYPRSDDAPSARFVEVPDYRLLHPANSRPALRIHKVAENDTLELLAERYLGSADRAMEILDLNRDVLSAPDALPIGVELRIPPRGTPAVEDDQILPEEPLVPIRR